MKKGWVYWTPRIVSIFFILFLALFSLDVFDSCNSFGSCTLGLFMHNIPVFILTAVLIISWRYEIVGGVVFILAGLVYAALNIVSATRSGWEWYYLSWIVQISGIAFFIGILFLAGWKRRGADKRSKKLR